MHRACAGLPRGIDQRVDAQVTARRGAWTDAHGLVRKLDVECVAVGLGVDRDGPQAQITQRANDPHRDLAAVGDEHRSEGAAHARRIRNRACPTLMVSSSLTQISTTVASAGALILEKSFIDSSNASVCPFRMAAPTSTNGG